jgi:mRNA-degrading endonuclease YafQ of YafQ-DinJ toxin-antitoxin module
MMEEDLKRNDIKPEPNENDKIIKQLVDKKDEIKKEFDENLDNFIKDIKELKDSYKDNELFIDKLNFLEIQIKHDIFNIIYKGFEEPDKNNDNNSDN